MKYQFSLERLRAIRATFAYDPATGVFRRLDGRARKRARTSAIPRYPQINVGGVIYYCHIVAYWMMIGEAVPDGFEIDHKDRDKTNCRWDNLRLVSSTDNKLNTATYSTNTSGVRGVSPTSSGTWDARIRLNGKVVILGRHKTIEAAIAARTAAEIKHFGATLTELHEQRRNL